jgi:formyl transferase-like protein
MRIVLEVPSRHSSGRHMSRLISRYDYFRTSLGVRYPAWFGINLPKRTLPEEYDAGPVIAQCEVPVAETDTPEVLAERVQERERGLMVEVLARIADGHIRLPLSENNDRRPNNPLQRNGCAGRSG